MTGVQTCALPILLELRDGDTSLAFPSNWHEGLRAVTGNGQQSLMRAGAFQRQMMVTEPGCYTIRAPKVPGYLEPPPQTIEVFAGRYTEHKVELEREHSR